MRGRSTERRQNSLGDLHASQVFRTGFFPNQNQLLVVVRVPLFFCIRRVKNDLPGGRTGTGVDALGQQAICSFFSFLLCQPD